MAYISNGLLLLPRQTNAGGEPSYRGGNMRSSILHPARRLSSDTTTAENCSFYRNGHQNLKQSGLETSFQPDTT